MTRQLSFSLPQQVARSRSDFFVSPANVLALAAVDGWRDWPAARMMLAGPTGAGKSHLAQIWAAETGAMVVAGADLAEADLVALSEGAALVVEDAEQVAGVAARETALFHLSNLAAARAQPLLLTAIAPPRDWGLVLPDLASRMQAVALTRLPPPDDALLAAVLVKLFADRQITVAANLIPYLVTRMDRSIDAARGLVAALDARSLSENRPITRALAAELLDRG